MKTRVELEEIIRNLKTAIRSNPISADEVVGQVARFYSTAAGKFTVDYQIKADAAKAFQDDAINDDRITEEEYLKIKKILNDQTRNVTLSDYGIQDNGKAFLNVLEPNLDHAARMLVDIAEFEEAINDSFRKPEPKAKEKSEDKGKGKDKGKSLENPISAKRKAIQANESMQVYLREDLLKNADSKSTNSYYADVVSKQFFEEGDLSHKSRYFAFRRNLDGGDLINGELMFGLNKSAFARLSDDDLIYHLAQALKVDRTTAIHIMEAHTQGVGGMLPFMVEFANQETEQGTASYTIKQGFANFRKINIYKDENNNIQLACEFDGLPLTSINDAMTVGYTAPMKAVFQLAQKNNKWGYELEYVATDDDLVKNVIHGKTLSEADILARVDSSTPSHYIDMVNHALNEAGMAPANIDRAPQPSQLELMVNLNPILLKMRDFEKQKYPKTSFSYLTTMLDNGMHLSYVRHSGGELTHSELKTSKEAALALRKLGLMAGVIYMFEKSDQFLTADPKQRQRIVNLLTAKAQDIADGKKSKQSYNTFVEKLLVSIGKELPPSRTKIRDVMRSVRNAERYFVAEYNQGRLLVNETNTGGDHVYQIDVPFGNKLSDAQKHEYVRIHSDDDKPLWFTELSPWEQDWLLEKVPLNIGDDWKSFEGLYISSTMQQIPSLKNARHHFLYKKEDDGFTKLSGSFKMSTMVPYEMPEMEKKRIVEMNAEQVVGSVMTAPNQPVLLNSLLGDVRVGLTIDVDITKRQVEAVNQVAPNAISGNDPTNIVRMLLPVTTDPAYLGRWSHIDKLLKIYDDNKSHLNTLAHEAANNLKEMHKKNIFSALLSRRNFMAHKAAYASILTEAMGGVVSTNCKSGKDRTGLDQLYRAAMLIYFERHQTLPKFDDNQKNRKEFVEIYKTLFSSMAVQEAAALNTPGSFGIIDNARVLCGDIKEALKTTYYEATEVGNFNKSRNQRQDEDLADKERQARDEILAKKSAIKAKAIPKPKAMPLDPNGLIYYGNDANVTKDKATAEAELRDKLNLPPGSKALGGLAATKGVTQKFQNKEARWIAHDVVDQKNQVTIHTGAVQSYDNKNCKEDLYGDLNKFKKVPRKKEPFSMFPRADIPGLPVIQWATAAIENFEEINTDKKPIYINQGTMPNVCVEALILVALVMHKEYRHDSSVKVTSQQVEFLRANWDTWAAKNKSIISDVPALEESKTRKNGPIPTN